MAEHRVEFRLSENPWAPTAVVDELNARHGCGLRFVGIADQVGGTSSAAFVEWPDGRAAALTRTLAPASRMRQTAEVLELARSVGIPVPRYELITELADGYVTVVQERMPGRHVYDAGEETIDTIVAENERFAGLLAERADVPVADAFPASSAGDYGPWEQTLGRYDDRSLRLLRALRALDGGRPYEMPGADLVHTDYSVDNILLDECGRVSGIVDWNQGAARGDCRFALVGLRMGSAGLRLPRDASARADEHLSLLDGDLLRVYQAHWRLRVVHGSIHKGFAPKRIDADIRAAEEFLSA